MGTHSLAYRRYRQVFPVGSNVAYSRLDSDPIARLAKGAVRIDRNESLSFRYFRGRHCVTFWITFADGSSMRVRSISSDVRTDISILAFTPRNATIGGGQINIC